MVAIQIENIVIKRDNYQSENVSQNLGDVICNIHID
jgi:hypothetical protein